MIDYSRYPRPESMAYFEKAMHRHNSVQTVEKLEDYYYRIFRYDMAPVNAVITNYYSLGLGELLDILEEYPNANCVITISNWNGCTEQAYREGKRNRVGVFKMGEFMGAINCARPYTYIRPIDRENNDGYGRRFGH